MAAKMDEAAKRRVRAGRLLPKDKSPAKVGKLVGASRQTVYRGLGVLWEQGIDGLREKSKGGRPSRMTAGCLAEPRQPLLAGPIASGYGTDLWTLKRVRLLIEKRFGVRYGDFHVWRILGAMGLSSRKSGKRAIERDEGTVQTWKRKTWPGLKNRPGEQAA